MIDFEKLWELGEKVYLEKRRIRNEDEQIGSYLFKLFRKHELSSLAPYRDISRSSLCWFVGLPKSVMKAGLEFYKETKMNPELFRRLFFPCAFYSKAFRNQLNFLKVNCQTFKESLEGKKKLRISKNDAKELQSLKTVLEETLQLINHVLKGCPIARFSKEKSKEKRCAHRKPEETEPTT